MHHLTAPTNMMSRAVKITLSAPTHSARRNGQRACVHRLHKIRAQRRPGSDRRARTGSGRRCGGWRWSHGAGAGCRARGAMQQKTWASSDAQWFSGSVVGAGRTDAGMTASLCAEVKCSDTRSQNEGGGIRCKQRAATASEADCIRTRLGYTGSHTHAVGT